VKPSVCVLVPFRERFEPAFLFNTWLPLYEARLSLDFCTLYINRFLMTDMPHVSTARNGLVRMASNRQPDYVYFLDADMVAEDSVECLRLLLETVGREDVDVVSGLYLDKRNMEPCFKSALSAELLSNKIEGEKPFEVEWVDPRVRFNHIGLFQLTPEGEIKRPA